MRKVFGFLALTAAWFWAFPIATPNLAYADTPTGLEKRAGALVKMGDVGTGSLLLRSSAPGFYVEAPRVATDVHFDITGPVIRARVTQRFQNPSDQWVEGTYVFPLPEDAGVDTMKIIIGDRFIEGQVKERQEARQIYERARDEGRRASLVEQERPNMFTNSVANIGPGETVVVQIEYQDAAAYKDGVFSMRFPMVVGPRYIPTPEFLQSVSLDGRTGFAMGPSAVPDAERITPPVVRPEAEPDEGLRLPVTITADLRAGFDIGEIDAPFHNENVDNQSNTRARITLDEAVPANRDFVLEWRAANGQQPQAALFKEEREGETYYLAMVTPPALAAMNDDAPRRPREAIFVIDNSGSMSGPSMPQAKAALLLALQRLTEQDTFNVVRFDDTFEVLFTDAVEATPENVQIAQAFVAGLEANGGTEMLPALRAALTDLDPMQGDRVRQVVFLTDGAIGNEAELFQAIENGLGQTRLFTVGIGSAPNSYFMTRAARMGRGTFTYIGDVTEVAERAAELFEALERPVMTDLAVQFPAGSQVESWPNPLPDLYAGEPVMLTARVDNPGGTMRVSGELAGQRWASDMSLEDAADGAGVSTLWARAKIAATEELRFEGVDYQEIDKAVLKTALDFSLVSRLTSLVAVDVSPARPVDAALVPADIPTMLPDGWVFDKVFGEEIEERVREAQAVPATQFAALATRSAPGEALVDAAGLPLPQGSTDAALRMALGAALMLLGFTVAFAAIRRCRAPVRQRP